MGSVKKVLFVISAILFFAGFCPKGWGIFACLLLVLGFALLAVKPGLKEKFERSTFYLSVAGTFVYGMYVFITLNDKGIENVIFEMVVTLITTLGAFWFMLNVIGMLPSAAGNKEINAEEKSGVGKASVIYLLIAAIVNVGVLCQSSPLYPMNLWDDVNSYVTVSRSMAAGKILYKDIFDHKGPVLHFLNVPFSFLNHKSYLGVFLLEVLVCFIWLFISIKIISLFMKPDRFVYAFMLPLAMLTYSVNSFYYGGSTEEYALPLLAIGLYIGLKAVKKNRLPDLKEALMAGLASGVLFWMKFTLTGLYIGFIIFVIYRCIKAKSYVLILKLAGMFTAGFALITLPVLAYFAVTGSLSYLYEAYFYFNIFVYSGDSVSVLGRIPYALILLFIQLGRNPVLAVFVALGLLYIISRKNKDEIIFVFLCYLSTYSCLYAGEKPMFYYCFGLAPFSVFGWSAILVLIKAVMGRLSRNAYKGVIAGAGTIAFAVAAFSASSSTLNILQDRSTIPQCVFAKTITESGDPTVLNFKCLDSGIYNAADIVPEYRFFYQVNYPGSFTKAVDEPLAVVRNNEVRFVVTNDLFDLSQVGYRMKDVREYACIDINGNVSYEPYYLFELE